MLVYRSSVRFPTPRPEPKPVSLSLLTRQVDQAEQIILDYVRTLWLMVEEDGPLPAVRVEVLPIQPNDVQGERTTVRFRVHGLARVAA
jgi:hypothetical protein